MKVHSLKIKDLPIGARPREAFMRAAEPTREIPDASLLAILIRTGRKGASAIDLAHRLINHFGSAANLVDATDPQSLSAAETAGRCQVREIMAFFREYVPGAEDVRLLSTASVVGIRESRHVLGEYILGKDDVIEGRVPADSVFLCSNSIDLHAGRGASGTLYMTIRDGNWYGVPYRCLVPKNIDGLLVAGRCVSASSVAAAAIRVMPPCMAMGQAAGTAAALVARSGITPRTLNAAKLAEQLKSDGVWLG